MLTALVVTILKYESCFQVLTIDSDSVVLLFVHSTLLFDLLIHGTVVGGGGDTEHTGAGVGATGTISHKPEAGG